MRGLDLGQPPVIVPEDYFQDSVQRSIDSMIKRREENNKKCFPEYEYLKQLPVGSKHPRFCKRTKLVLDSRQRSDSFELLGKLIGDHLIEVVNRPSVLHQILMRQQKPIEYTVVCDRSNNTDESIANNELVVDVTIHNPITKIHIEGILEK